MASQQYIITLEEKVIAAKNAVNELQDAAHDEVQVGHNPANYDCWGTTLINLEILESCVKQAIASVREAKDGSKQDGDSS